MLGISQVFDEPKLQPRKCVDCGAEFATVEEVAHHWCEEHGGKPKEERIQYRFYHRKGKWHAEPMPKPGAKA